MNRSSAGCLDEAFGWLRETPKTWQLRPLKSLGQLIAGSAFPEAYQGVLDAELPFYKVKDLGSSTDGRHLSSTENTISRQTAEALRTRVVPVNAIVYAKIGAALLLNRRRITTVDACIDNNMTAFVPDPRVLTTEWAYYVLSSLDFGVFVNPGAVPSLSEGDQSGLVLPVPSIRDQERIVVQLDSETARIDKLITMQESLIERLDEYRTALITRVMTKGLPPEAAEVAGLEPKPERKNSGVEWLGEVPEHWEVTRLSALARAGEDAFTDGDWVELPHITDGGIRLIQTGNVGIGKYREQGFRYIGIESFDELGCTEVCPDDVLICRLADPVGRACLAPDLGIRMIASVDVCILKPNKRHSAKYLVHMLSTKCYLGYVESLVRGGTRDRISRSMLGAIRVAVPPRREQLAIAEYLEAHLSRVSALRGKAQSLIERLYEYRSAVISAAVTGKVDVRDAALAVAGDGA